MRTSPTAANETDPAAGDRRQPTAYRIGGVVAADGRVIACSIGHVQTCGRSSRRNIVNWTRSAAPRTARMVDYLPWRRDPSARVRQASGAAIYAEFPATFEGRETVKRTDGRTFTRTRVNESELCRQNGPECAGHGSRFSRREGGNEAVIRLVLNVMKTFSSRNTAGFRCR